MAQSDSSGFKKVKGSGDGQRAGFRAPEKQKKGMSRFMKGSLAAAFAGAALGGGVMLADMTRDDSAQVRTISKGEFNNATVLGEKTLFFGPDSRQYHAYQSYLNHGQVTAGESFVKLSRDMQTVYQVSPASSNGENGIKYVDVTKDAIGIDYNSQLVVDMYMTREYSSVLRQLSEIDDDFDPHLGIVKVMDIGGGTLAYHIFADDKNYGHVRIISDDYYANNKDTVDTARHKMRDMSKKTGIWDHAWRWDAYVSKIRSECMQYDDCHF